MLHPDILWRTHAEVDSVIGTDRLPMLADMVSLPYVEAVLLKLALASRWSTRTSARSTGGYSCQRLLHSKGCYHNGRRLVSLILKCHATALIG